MVRSGTIQGQAAWIRLRLAVSGARGSRLEPTPPSVGGSVRRPQQIPRAGAVSLISAYGPKVLVEGDHAIADFRWPMATVPTAVAVCNSRRRGAARWGFRRGNK